MGITIFTNSISRFAQRIRNKFKKKKESAMASIFDVAAFILEKKGTMTAMKLQKLCYYAQAWSLAWNEVPIFNEDFEAWANGPVCTKMFAVHKGKFVLNQGFFDAYGQSSNLTDEQKNVIQIVIDYYGDWEPQELSDLTHREDPWKNARRGVPMGAACDIIIEKDSMQQYYSGLMNEE